MRHFLVSLALIAASSSPAFAQYDPREFSIWNGSSLTITFRDNGVVTCTAPPLEMCEWRMSDGHHRVDLTAENGQTIYMTVQVPTDDLSGGFSVMDCNFSGGC